MSLTFTIIVFSILGLTYILSTFIEYYKTSKPKEKKLIQTLEKIQKIGFILMALFIFVGFILYFKKQYAEYYKSWSTITFLVGVNKCKSLQ